MTSMHFPPPLAAISRRIACTLTLLLASGVAVPLPAAAQAVYRYTGLPFTLFSCGPSPSGSGTLLCSSPAPGNPYTSYTATDRVTAALTLTAPLPANLALADVRSMPGFRLELSDGRHSVTDTQQAGMAAEVATDGAGNIVRWRLIINTGGLDNGGIATQNATFVADSGTLRCCDPTVSGDLARNSNLPGSWTGGVPSPAAATRSLITLVASPDLGLTQGQVASLTDKLANALESIVAGLNKQAINQLNAFIASVQSSAKTGKMSEAAAAMLTAAAQAIIAML